MRSKNSSRENLWGTRGALWVKKKWRWTERDAWKKGGGGEEGYLYSDRGRRVRLKIWKSAEEKINQGRKCEKELAK